jgi:hypothetical protein
MEGMVPRRRELACGSPAEKELKGWIDQFLENLGQMIVPT